MDEKQRKEDLEMERNEISSLLESKGLNEISTDTVNLIEENATETQKITLKKIDPSNIEPNDLSSIQCIENEIEPAAPEISTDENQHVSDKYQIQFTNFVQTMLNSNENLAPKRFKCNDCSKEFDYKSAYIIHSQIHRVDKQYKCDQCKRGFSNKYSLTAHKNLHLDENPYKCDHCQKAFNRAANLKGHIRRAHLN